MAQIGTTHVSAQETHVRDAREALLATLGSVEPIVTMSHEDVVVIALGSRVGRPEAEYLTLCMRGCTTVETAGEHLGGCASQP